MTPRCPSCLRPQLVGHPAGLVFDHGLACPLLDREDATRAADHERLAGRHAGRTIARPVTSTERTLLAAAGATLAPGAQTYVEAITPGVLRRTWPGIALDTTPTTVEENPS